LPDKQQKRLSNETIVKVMKIHNLIKLFYKKSCTFDETINFMYDKTLEQEPQMKQLVRDMEYNSGMGNIMKKYGSTS